MASISCAKGKAMRLSLKELVEIAIKNQPIILEQELEKGVPLNYLDENGDYVLRYPDGRIEKSRLPPLEEYGYHRDRC